MSRVTSTFWCCQHCPVYDAKLDPRSSTSFNTIFKDTSMALQVHLKAVIFKASQCLLLDIVPPRTENLWGKITTLLGESKQGQ